MSGCALRPEREPNTIILLNGYSINTMSSGFLLHIQVSLTTSPHQRRFCLQPKLSNTVNKWWEYSALNGTCTSHPFSQGLGAFKKGDGSRLKELEVADTFNHSVFFRYNKPIAIWTYSDYDTIRKTSVCSNHIKMLPWRREGKQKISLLAEDILVFDSWWERRKQFSLVVCSLVGWELQGRHIYPRLAEQHKLNLVG